MAQWPRAAARLDTFLLEGPMRFGTMRLKITRSSLRVNIVLAAFATLLAGAGFIGAAELARAAHEWPSRPITMIVPFAAGGPTDVVGRIIAQRLGEVLEQQIVVENVGGAGGMTGAQRG